MVTIDVRPKADDDYLMLRLLVAERNEAIADDRLSAATDNIRPPEDIVPSTAKLT